MGKHDEHVHNSQPPSNILTNPSSNQSTTKAHPIPSQFTSFPTSRIFTHAIAPWRKEKRHGNQYTRCLNSKTRNSKEETGKVIDTDAVPNYSCNSSLVGLKVLGGLKIRGIEIL